MYLSFILYLCIVTKSNKILSLFVLVLFSLQILVPISIFVHFKVNQYQIEQQFCVNIEKPELDCHGKCHLSKEIARVNVTTKKDKNNNHNTIQIDERPVIFSNYNLASVDPLEKVKNGQQFFYVAPHSEYFHLIDTPPPQFFS